MAAALALIAIAVPASAKKPATRDEAAVRAIIKQTYAGYSKVDPDSPDVATEGYEPTYSVSLDSLKQRWMPIGSGEELVQMNGFDWYCQCQDYSAKVATITAQKYDVKSKNKIEAKIHFAPGGGKGRPLTFIFIRENGQWVMDDLRFDGGSTLRKGLQADIDGAASTNAI
jgi:hypothetical protein